MAWGECSSIPPLALAEAGRATGSCHLPVCRLSWGKGLWDKTHYGWVVRCLVRILSPRKNNSSYHILNSLEADTKTGFIRKAEEAGLDFWADKQNETKRRIVELRKTLQTKSHRYEVINANSKEQNEYDKLKRLQLRAKSNRAWWLTRVIPTLEEVKAEGLRGARSLKPTQAT